MRILVIRLGALGDLFLSFPAFAAIRAHHPDAEITLLTTAPFRELGAASPWFDRIAVDPKPGLLDLAARRALHRALAGFDFVYDLQTSGRSSRHFARAGRPPWSGIARGASHPDDDPRRDLLHTVDRQAGQLRRAGISRFPPPSLEWLAPAEPAARGGKPRALLVPGAAPHRPRKRWPVERFAALARRLADDGLEPVVVGSAGDGALGAAIARSCPGAVDMTGRTDLAGIARLARGAALAVGNDTGPMHVAATLGCPVVVLFSAESDPALTAPRGAAPVRVLRVADLATLPVEAVHDAARSLRAASCTGGRSPP